jgi:hypothetical protein
MAVETKEQIREVYGDLLADTYDRLHELDGTRGGTPQDVVNVLADFGVSVANSVAHEVLEGMGLILEGDIFSRGDELEATGEDEEE